MDNKKSPKISGVPCPKCGQFIPISMHHLLESLPLFCPNCGLKLEMNKPTTEKILKMKKIIN